MWLKAADEKSQLDMGIEVEKEHIETIRWIYEQGGKRMPPDFIQQAAERIAKDHLKEMPDYYTKLKQMEASDKKGEGSNVERS